VIAPHLPSVALFTYSTLPRGSVVHASYLADALHDAGCEVTLYALDKDRRGFFRPLRARLELVAASEAPTSTAELVRVRAGELAAHLERLRPRHDVHHAQDCLSASGLLALKGRGGRFDLVRTVHHVEDFADPYLARCQERSILEPRVCLAVSDTVERDIWRSFGVRSETVGNGVEASRFARPDPRAVLEWTRRLDVGGGPVVLAVGGVEERKNTVRILRAFARLRGRHPFARLWLLGGATVLDHGRYRAAFDRELASFPSDLRGAVTELGLVADDAVPAIFRLANVLAFPSLLEGFGLVALEGMAAGLPVVVSRRAPFTEYLDDSCAVFVDPLSEEDIARGFEDALDLRPGRIERAAARARSFSWERVAARHLDIYRRMPVGGGVAPELAPVAAASSTVPEVARSTATAREREGVR
jgi:glycosyltransferase-like protein